MSKGILAHQNIRPQGEIIVELEFHNQQDVLVDDDFPSTQEPIQQEPTFA